MGIDRRRFIKKAGIAGIALVGAACAPSAVTTPAPGSAPTKAPAAAVASPTTTAPGKPIKIGVSLASSGPTGIGGRAMRPAIEAAFEGHDNQAAGRKIQLIFEDDEAIVTTAQAKAVKLVEQDNVNIMLGPNNTALGYAVRDYLDGKKVPTFLLAAGSRNTRDLYSRYVFRLAPGGYQYAYEPVKWLPKNGLKRVIYIASEFALSHEIDEAITKTMQEEGGTITQRFFPPLGTTDFAPYLTQFKTDQADAVLPSVLGEDAVRFLKQYDEFGLRAKLPIVALGGFIDEGISLPGQGDLAIGVKAIYTYVPTVDNPVNNKFVQQYKAKTNILPGPNMFHSVIGAEIIWNVLNAVGGDVENTDKFLQAAEKVKFEGPMGPVYFDEKHGLVHQMQVFEARKVANEVHTYRIGTMPDVKDPYSKFP